LDPLLLFFKEKVNKKIIKRRSVRKSKREIDMSEGGSEREIGEGDDLNPYLYFVIVYI
jgi:hypothetical protein